jgi:hypothetical protein
LRSTTIAIGKLEEILVSKYAAGEINAIETRDFLPGKAELAL